MVHVLLKPGLENFDHYFTSMWDECNCAVVWALFDMAFLWDWNENWPFQSCGHCWVFQICWHFECSTFTASSFRIWNSSTGIPSPPLALFIVMLSKAHLTAYKQGETFMRHNHIRVCTHVHICGNLNVKHSLLLTMLVVRWVCLLMVPGLSGH